MSHRIGTVPFRFVAASTLFGGMLVAATVAGAGPAAAIEEGTPITQSPGWAAYVTTVSKFLGTQTQETSCTGTIIANDWVLTAAHCVVTEDKNGNPTSTPIPLSKFEVVLDRSDLTQTTQGGQWTVDRSAVDPSWDPSHLANDVALLHLHGALPTGATPLPLAPSSFNLSDGQTAAAYGYGDTSETYTKATLSKGNWNTYKGTTSNVLRLTQSGSYTQQSSCSTGTDWCMHRNGPSEILHGDSGGPWVPDTTNPFLVGVTSYNSNPQSTSSTTVVWQYHHATRLTSGAIHDWVTSTAGIPAPTANTIYRDSASGASWLGEFDGFLHPIPTGDTYLCLTGQGDPVDNQTAFQLDELPRSTTNATCSSSLTSGDLLVGVGNGQVAQYDASGNVVGHLDTGTASAEETGGCFAPSGEYYQTNFSDGSVTKFASNGSVENSRWATSAGTPESCLVAADGTVYVGNASGSLIQLTSSGSVTAVMSPQVQNRGIDWISQGPDPCTIRYTSEGDTVFQYDVCTTTQLPVFAALLGNECYANAPLADGGLLVACSSDVVRLDQNGAITMTYPSPGGFLFSLAARPSDSSFYVGAYAGTSSTVYQIDLASGTTLRTFTPSPEYDVAGLAIAP